MRTETMTLRRSLYVGYVKLGQTEASEIAALTDVQRMS